MKLSMRHPFSCTPEAYWKSYWDPGFDAELQRVSGIQREVLSEEQEGSLRVRRQRFTSNIVLPAAVSSVLGTNKVQYEQKSKIDDAKMTISWEVVPPVLPDKIKASGVMRVEATPDGCVQILEGDVTCAIFMVGAKVESAVADTLAKAQDGTAALRRKWLAQQGS